MIFDRVQQLIIKQLAVDADAVTMSTSFVDDLGTDSLDIAELTMAIEEEFDLPELEEDVLSGLYTVGDVVKYISEQIGD